MNSNKGVLILAGGKSERMNFPKAYLLFNGITFLKKIVKEYYNAGIRNIFVVLNKDLCDEKWLRYIDEVRSLVTLIENPDPDRGRFYSLKLGIKKMLHLEFCFIQNIDNPFVNASIIKSMLKSGNAMGYTSSSFNQVNGHPVLISDKIMHRINQVSGRNNNLRSVLAEFSRRQVEVKCNDILININTVEDYEKYVMKKITL